MTFLQVLVVSMVLMGAIFALLMLFVRSRMRKHSQVETAEKRPLNFWGRVLFLLRLVGSGISSPFIGSEGDHLELYAQYAGENAELWVLPDAGHCGGPRARPEEYAGRMVEFFDTAFDIQRK